VKVGRAQEPSHSGCGLFKLAQNMQTEDSCLRPEEVIHKSRYMRRLTGPFAEGRKECLEGPDLGRSGPRLRRHNMSYVFTPMVTTDGKKYCSTKCLRYPLRGPYSYLLTTKAKFLFEGSFIRVLPLYIAYIKLNLWF
jgi:hypothetical protein